MPINEVIELVHEDATDPPERIVPVLLDLSALLDHTRHEIRVIDHLEAAAVGTEVEARLSMRRDRAAKNGSSQSRRCVCMLRLKAGFVGALVK